MSRGGPAVRRVRTAVRRVDVTRLAVTTRHDAAEMWLLARRYPTRAITAVLAAVVAAGSVASMLITLLTSPLQALGAFVSTGLTLLLAGSLVWALGAVAALVAGGAARWMGWWLLPYTARARLSATVRRLGARAAGAVAVIVDVVIAPTLLTLPLTVALILAVAVLTRARRRDERQLRWLAGHLTGAAREFDPDSGDWEIREPEFDQQARLVSAQAWYPASLRVAEPARRAAIERAVMWAMRHQPQQYAVVWVPGARMARIVTEPPLPDRLLDGQWPPLPGIVLGACPVVLADARVATGPDDDPVLIGLRTWNPNAQRDLLIAGVKGSGKTILSRGVIVRGLRAGWFPAGVMILDGKASADYAALEGRDGVLVVARSPEQWRAGFTHLVSIMQDRYEQDYAFESGQLTEPPDLPRMALVIDEVQAVVAELGEEALDPLSALARMARGARITLIVITQRPDSKDAIPGAIRDQLEDRVAVGWMSQDGARMVLGDDWRLVVDDDDPTGEAATITKPRGRAVARIAGRLSRIQVPWLDSPVRDPGVEPLYPPRETPPPPAPVIPKPRAKRARRPTAAAAAATSAAATDPASPPDPGLPADTAPAGESTGTTSGPERTGTGPAGRPRRRGRPTA